MESALPEAVQEQLLHIIASRPKKGSKKVYKHARRLLPDLLAVVGFDKRKVASQLKSLKTQLLRSPPTDAHFLSLIVNAPPFKSPSQAESAKRIKKNKSALSNNARRTLQSSKFTPNLTKSAIFRSSSIPSPFQKQADGSAHAEKWTAEAFRASDKGNFLQMEFILRLSECESTLKNVLAKTDFIEALSQLIESAKLLLTPEQYADLVTDFRTWLQGPRGEFRKPSFPQFMGRVAQWFAKTQAGLGRPSPLSDLRPSSYLLLTLNIIKDYLQVQDLHAQRRSTASAADKKLEGFSRSIQPLIKAVEQDNKLDSLGLSPQTMLREVKDMTSVLESLGSKFKQDRQVQQFVKDALSQYLPQAKALDSTSATRLRSSKSMPPIQTQKAHPAQQAINKLLEALQRILTCLEAERKGTVEGLTLTVLESRNALLTMWKEKDPMMAVGKDSALNTYTDFSVNKINTEIVYVIRLRDSYKNITGEGTSVTIENTKRLLVQHWFKGAEARRISLSDKKGANEAPKKGYDGFAQQEASQRASQLAQRGVEQAHNPAVYYPDLGGPGLLYRPGFPYPQAGYPAYNAFHQGVAQLPPVVSPYRFPPYSMLSPPEPAPYPTMMNSPDYGYPSAAYPNQRWDPHPINRYVQISQGNRQVPAYQQSQPYHNSFVSPPIRKHHYSPQSTGHQDYSSSKRSLAKDQGKRGPSESKIYEDRKKSFSMEPQSLTHLAKQKYYKYAQRSVIKEQSSVLHHMNESDSEVKDWQESLDMTSGDDSGSSIYQAHEDREELKRTASESRAELMRKVEELASNKVKEAMLEYKTPRNRRPTETHMKERGLNTKQTQKAPALNDQQAGSGYSEERPDSQYGQDITPQKSGQILRLKSTVDNPTSSRPKGGALQTKETAQQLAGQQLDSSDEIQEQLQKDSDESLISQGSDQDIPELISSEHSSESPPPSAALPPKSVQSRKVSPLDKYKIKPHLETHKGQLAVRAIQEPQHNLISLDSKRKLNEQVLAKQTAVRNEAAQKLRQVLKSSPETNWEQSSPPVTRLQSKKRLEKPQGMLANLNGLLQDYMLIRKEKIDTNQDLAEVDGMISLLSKQIETPHHTAFLKDAFNRYAGSAMDYSSFMAFCTDFHITDAQSPLLSQKTLKRTYEQVADPSGLSFGQFKLAVKRMAEEYFGPDYDLLHASEFHKLGSAKKLSLFCGMIEAPKRPLN